MNRFVLILLVCAAGPICPAQEASIPSADEIASVIEITRSEIHDYHVVVEGRKTQEGGDRTFAYYKFDHYAKAGKAWTDATIGPDAQTIHQKTTASWDGQAYRMVRGEQDTVSAKTGYLLSAPRKTELDILGDPVQWSMLLEAPKAKGIPRTTGDLAGYLRVPSAANIQAVRQKVGDVSCLVVRVGPPDHPLTYYLDESRSFAVVRYERRDPSLGNRIVFRLDNADLKEVLPGVWLPTRMNRTSFGKDGNTVTSAEEFTVHTIECNKGIPDSRFKLVFPPGTTIIDQVKNIVYQTPAFPSAEEVASIAEYALPKNDDQPGGRGATTAAGKSKANGKAVPLRSEVESARAVSSFSGTAAWLIPAGILAGLFVLAALIIRAYRRKSPG